MKYDVVFRTVIPVPLAASMDHPSIRYGSAWVPTPPVTPFADVNAESPSIKMGPWEVCGNDARFGENFRDSVAGDAKPFDDPVARLPRIEIDRRTARQALRVAIVDPPST